jgi:CRISPR/Cas system CMR subunit Cmr6 (Cas7 group RAMP superfamily)
MSSQDHHVEERLNDVVGQLSAKALLIVDRVIQAMNKFQTNNNKITRTDLKGISEAIKEMEEKILRLKIKTKEHI